MLELYIVSWVDHMGDYQEEPFNALDYEFPYDEAKAFAALLRPHRRGTVRLWKGYYDCML